MSPTPRPDLSSPAGPPSSAAPARTLGSCRPAAWAVAAALLALLLLHRDTAGSMAAVWLRSQTFAHGLAIVPLSAWLVWRRRAMLAALPCRPAWGALPLLAVLGAAWLLATAAHVPVVRQYAFAAMIPVAVLGVLGLRRARAIAFPLLYLLLAVPFGEVFVPPLVDFTAWFTVAALQLAGIPVLREHNFLTLPTGDWSVVEACSGLRYLIASLALGALYAHLNYRSARRRLAFMAAALVLPVLANGMRAFTIVLIGHVGGMHLAAGIDHVIYGWVFFGLVSLLLFWLGSFWRETPAPSPPAVAAAAAASAPARTLAAAAVAVTAVVACWPLLAGVLLQQRAAAPPPSLAIVAPPPWRAAALAETDWQLAHAGAPQRFAASYSDGQASVSLQLAWYASQQRDAALLAPAGHDDNLQRWHETVGQLRQVRVGGVTLEVRESLLRSTGSKLLVWRWYRQGGRDTASPQQVKLLLARARLLRGREDGAEIVVATPAGEQTEQAAAVLQRFLDATLPAIDRELRHAAAD